MNKNIVIQILLFSFAVYGIDYLVLKLLNKSLDTFIYPLPLLISFFGFFSLSIVLFLNKISKTNLNNVGFTFLFLTCLKMVFAFVFLKPILNATSIYAASEKINFFIIFILFLAIETIITIRILNKK